MKIHGLCLLKNEADIVRASLTAAVEWCDYIYVFDNGSTDGTWEIILELSQSYPQIVPYKSEDRPFKDGLRSEIFDAYRDRAAVGDWWCRLDADEFYVDDPRVFLSKTTPPYDVVWSASISYYFTDRDAARYRQDPSLYADDVPVQEKCRYYLSHWGEIRFMRHTADLVWYGDGGWPRNLTIDRRSYPSRIALQHYAYRSPQQINRRLATRRAAVASGEFRHEAVANFDAIDPQVMEKGRWSASTAEESELRWSWESRVVSADKLQFDNHDHRFVFRQDLMPPIPTPAPPSWRQHLLRTGPGRVLRTVWRNRSRIAESIAESTRAFRIGTAKRMIEPQAQRSS